MPGQVLDTGGGAGGGGITQAFADARYEQIANLTADVQAIGDVRYLQKLFFPVVNSNNTIAAGSSGFGTLSGGTNPAENVRQVVAPFAFHAIGLIVVTANNQPATGALTCTIRNAGVNGAVTFVIAAGAGAGIYSDFAHSMAFAVNDLLSIGFANGAPGLVSAQINHFITVLGV